MAGMQTSAADAAPARPMPMGLVGIDALAARLGVTDRFVRRLVEERRIPYFKIGRLVRFDPAEVERWIAATRVDPDRIPIGTERTRS